MKIDNPFHGERCDICKNLGYIYDKKSYEFVCPECGFVQEERAIDISGGVKEIRYEQSQNPFFRLGSLIGYKNRGVRNKKFTPKEVVRAVSLRKYHFRNFRERKLRQMKAWLDIYLGKIEANEILKKEAYSILYKVVKDSEENNYRYNDLRVLIPAIIHIASKLHGFSISFEEMVRATGIKKKKITHASRLIIKNLDIKILFGSKEYIHSLKMYIVKFSEALNVSIETQNYCFEILDKIKRKWDFSGIDPKGLVAGIIYVACSENSEKRTQKQISAVTQMTEGTLRTRKKDILLLL